MKISNAYMFSRAVDNMTAAQEKLSTVQLQLSKGKQVVKPSDAPDQTATIERYQSLIQRQESFQKSINSLSARLQTEDTALASAGDLLIRMKELSLQAANDTLGVSDRKALATEMRGLRDQILSLANSQDSNGNYIFSGSRVQTPPFVSIDGGSPSYQGDQSRMQVPVGDQRSVLLNRSGTEVFSRVVRMDKDGNAYGVGFFQSLDETIQAISSSDSTGMQQGIKELDSHLGNISLARAQIGTDQNVLQAQQEIVDSTKLTLKTVLSSVEDLDYATAISQLNQQTLALQAAQSSFAKVSQLNLFNYIN